MTWTKEKQQAYDRERRKDPEIRAKHAEVRARKAAQTREYRIQGKCGVTRGVTLAKKLEMFHAQGFCAIRGQSMVLERHKINSAHIDHDHKTGRVRGLLCVNCNHGIGKLKDNPHFLENAAYYLRLYAS